MDVGVVGEGEDTLLELVRVFPVHHWEDPEELEGIRGIAFHVRLTAREVAWKE